MNTLYKRTSTGAVQIWRKELDGCRHRTVSGQIDGEQVTSAWATATPKNVGKSNELTAEQQAEAEVKAAYEAKLSHGGYHESIDDIDKPKFFKPMLAKNYNDYVVDPSTVWSQPKLDGVRCCLGSTLIMTRRGLTQAKLVRQGDEVVCSDGSFTKVLNVFERKPEESELLTTVHTWAGIPVTFTSDHQFLVGDRWVEAAQLGNKDWLTIPIPKLETNFFEHSIKLEAGHGYNKRISIDEEFMWFCGLFVGDGSAHTVGSKTRGRIALSVNSRDVEIIDRLQLFILSIGCEPLFHHPDGVNMVNIFFTDLPLALWLNNTFREQASDGAHYSRATAHSKTIPDWFDSLTDQLFSAFKEGWVSADGYTSSDGTEKVVTVSSGLAGKMYRQFLARGILVSLKKEKTRWEYLGEIKNGNCFKLTFLRSDRNLRLVDDCLLARVKAVETKKVKPSARRYSLYDFEVESEKHDFWASTIVHNCIATAEGMFSRLGKPILSCPHIMEALKPAFDADPDLIFDGELYADKLSDNFNEIISLVRKQKPDAVHFAKTADNIQYHVYDLPSHDGGFVDRYVALTSVLPESSVLVRVETSGVGSQEILDNLFSTYVEAGYEGQMVRTSKGRYKNGRSVDLLKRKDFVDAEYRIVSVNEGNGNRSGMAGYITYDLGDGRTFDSGIKGSWRYATQLLRDANKYVGGVGTVRYFNLTPDGVPRFPVTVAVYESDRDM